MSVLVAGRVDCTVGAVLVAMLLFGSGCSTGTDAANPLEDDGSAGPVSPMTPQRDGEVYVLPETLPPGYAYVSTEIPTVDTHVTFVGAVVAANDAQAFRVSVRWSTRPDTSGAEEDRPADPPATRVAGRDVHVNDRFARVPITDETDVWLSFEMSIEELPDGLFESVVSSLVEVDEAEWRALLAELSDQQLAFDNAELAGLCEDVISDFADGEPSPSTTEELAAAQFVTENRILEGLVFEDGRILHRGEEVGSYRVIERPGNTFAIESAEWCYPGS